MYDGDTDKAVVMLVLSGNSEAYGDIVHKYKDMVFNAVCAMIKNYHTAEDLTQDTFIDGYIKLKSLGEPYNVGAWLVKIAKNKCYNHMTRSALRFESELHEYLPDDRINTPENFMMEQYDREKLKQAVNKLPELHKTVIELYYFENRPQNKIAELLRIPVGTVSRRLYDAKMKLRKELDIMSETIKNVDFEKEVAKRIKALWNYYHLHNFSNDGKQNEVDDFIKFIDNMPESKLKHKAYASAYSYSVKEDHKSKIETEAELGENAEVYFNRFWDKYANNKGNEEWLKAIDGDEGISKVEKMENSGIAVGQMYFWRGACNTRLKNLKEARKDFETALEKLNRDNSYHPNALAALKGIDALETDPDKYLTGGFNVTGELFRLYDGGKKLDFVSQPGFGMDNIFYPKNSFDSIYYYGSSMGHNRKFFDMNMKEGETAGEDTLVSQNETVTVIAGTFENCVHIKSVPVSGYWADEGLVGETWYAKDVGIIKFRAKSNEREEEIYELCEYKINGGNGYLMPATVGNLWKYKNVNLPDFYEQIIEYETVSVFDDPETESTYIYVSAFQLLKVARDNCDSDILIMLAGEAVPYKAWSEQPKKMDFDTAIKNLKLAVQKNSSVRASLYAAAGVEYLERFKEYYEKSWHMLPCCLDSRILIRDRQEGKIKCRDNTNRYYIAPSQDWGSWFDDRKCLARNPFRYLQELFGMIYSDKWVAGYTEQIKHEDGEIYLKAEDGGTITTKTGTFGNCIKVTVELEKADETDENYYVGTPRYSHCGTKIYYYAPNVGIVKYECIWGKALYASMELTEYRSYATNGEYMPVYIGNKWIYDEVTLPPEFMEKTKFEIVSGMEDEFFMVCEGDVLFMGTDEEYEEFRKSREK